MSNWSRVPQRFFHSYLKSRWRKCNICTFWDANCLLLRWPDSTTEVQQHSPGACLFEEEAFWRFVSSSPFQVYVLIFTLSSHCRLLPQVLRAETWKLTLWNVTNWRSQRTRTPSRVRAPFQTVSSWVLFIYLSIFWWKILFTLSHSHYSLEVSGIRSFCVMLWCTATRCNACIQGSSPCFSLTPTPPPWKLTLYISLMRQQWVKKQKNKNKHQSDLRNVMPAWYRIEKVFTQTNYSLYDLLCSSCNIQSSANWFS